MSDIASIVERIQRDYMSPPGEQPARFIIQNLTGTPVALSASSSSDDILIDAAHGLVDGDKIVFTALTGGAGLETFRTYFVVNATTGTFQVALIASGTAVDFTTDISAATYQEVADLTASTVEFVANTDILSTEEEDLLAAGTLLEIESELVLLTDDPSGTSPSLTLTVRRGMYGTTAATHSDGTEVRIASEDYVPRQAVFDAVADSVEALWPDLWTIDVEETWADTEPIEIPAVAGEVVEMKVRQGSRWRSAGSWEQLQEFPLSSTNNALQVSGVVTNTEIQVYYKKIPTRPTAESDTLADLGVETGWVKVIVAASVAALIANRDLNQATIDFITQSLEAEAGGPIGSGTDIRNALLQFQDFQTRPLKRQLDQKGFNRVVVDSEY